MNRQKKLDIKREKEFKRWLNKNDILRRDYKYNLRFHSLEEVCHAIFVFGGADPDIPLDILDKKTEGKYDFPTLAKVPILHEPYTTSEDALFCARRIVDELRETFSASSSGWRHREYVGNRGIGPFSAATVSTKYEQNDTILLWITRPGENGWDAIREVGKKVEAPEGYHGFALERTYAIKKGKDRYTIPLNDIEAVYRVFRCCFDQNTFFKALSTPVMYEGKPLTYHSYVSIIKNNYFTAKINICGERTVEPDELSNPRSDREYYNPPDRDYEFRMEGGYITGPAKILRTRDPGSIGLELEVLPNIGVTYNPKFEKYIGGFGDAVEALWRASLTKPMLKRNCRAPPPEVV